MPISNAVWNDFKLRQGTREPGALKITDDVSVAVLTGIVTPEVLEEILTQGIETAVPDNSTGRISRTLPVAHPEWPSLFLKSVDNIQGIGFREKVAADPDGQLEVPSLPYRSRYEKYEVQCTFTSRPYPQVQDASIPSYTLNYHDTTGAAQSKQLYREYWRNVVWRREPAAEYLTADYGLFTFSVPGTPVAGNPEDGKSAGKGLVRQLLPSSTWLAEWYGVPYGYLLSNQTYFDRLQGHVNQLAFEGFEPGEALLQAVRVLRVYSPPMPTFEPWGGYNVVSQAKLCDLQFVILAVKRPATVAVTPSNLSHIPNHHNCAYYGSFAGGKAFYVENFKTGGPGTGVPTYPSAPFELLFSNPDTP